jgi:release factor glutamine methyltransferase
VTAPASAGQEPPTWRQLWSRAQASLGAGHESRWIAEEASGLEGSALLRDLDEPAPEAAALHLDEMVRRRLAGEPLQYVLGHWAFRGLDLVVDARVLIPRPETETVVEVALAELERLTGRGRPPVVVDLGTGSGAIALSIASENGPMLHLRPTREPEPSIWATDASLSALSLARANLAGLGAAASRVRLVDGDWYGALPAELRGGVDLVVSNPPYVSEEEWVSLDAVVREHEPKGALVSGPTGLEAIDAVVSGAPAFLARAGAVVVEIAPHQSRDGAGVARAAGFVEVEVRRDLAGRPRVLVARW